MTKLYRKNEVGFAILWIVLYVVLTSLADALSDSLGVHKGVTLALHAVMAAVLWFWIRKNGLTEKYGFCRSRVPAAKVLFYIPLILVATSGVWAGFAVKEPLAGTICQALSMLLVGFLEEVIFRGLLFKGMAKNNVRTAILVSALTFGIGHIVNLFTGQTSVETVMQIIFAVSWGFILTMVCYKSGSIIPSILAHALIDAFSMFAADQEKAAWVYIGATIVVGVLYCIYLSRLQPPKPDSADACA